MSRCLTLLVTAIRYFTVNCFFFLAQNDSVYVECKICFLFFSVFPSLDLSYTDDTKANVTVLDLKDIYEKGQSRRKANSEQRLLNADVHLKATAQKQIQVTRL